MIHDYCIVGGGIVGLATAMAILEARPGASLVLLEKEDGPARHQTGHNSGVIHSGIYYAPGSLKAELCKAGEVATKRFCAEHAIPFETCGKLIVATTPNEVGRLVDLADRARRNAIPFELLDAPEVARREPRVTALSALHIPSTGIVDYRRICSAICTRIEKLGATTAFGAKVDSIRETSDVVTVRSGDRSWQARKLIACAGLQSDRIARLAGLAINCRIVPFRGEYFRLPSDKSDIVRHLIYPVPHPDVPFLGIHVTRMIDGGVTVGPNAVLGLAREGYRTPSFDLRDMLSVVGYPGTWRSLLRHRAHALSELRNSLSRRAYVAECRKYCPELRVTDLQPCVPGIRAQIVRRDGSFVHDFLVEATDRTVHVLNAPSPAATSAIPIGRMIAARAVGPA